MTIKIEKPNPSDYLCRYKECHYIAKADDPFADIIKHVSENHIPENSGEKEGRLYKFVDKIFLWRSE